MRVPAAVEAFRSGAYVPTAGQFGVSSTTRSPSDAPLTEQNFQRQNLLANQNLSPVEKLMVQSFGNAGGVTNDQQ